MALFWNVVLAIVTFMAFWVLLGIIAPIIGSLFFSILKWVLIVGAVVWIVRLFQGIIK